MTEFASHHPPPHHDEGHHQMSRSFSNNPSHTQYIDTWIKSQMNDHTEDRVESLAPQNRKFYMNGVPDFGVNAPFSFGDLKMYRKSDIRPSDSSYTKKLSWDANNSSEASPLVQSLKSHFLVSPISQDVKQESYDGINHNSKLLTDSYRQRLDPDFIDKRKIGENRPHSYLNLSCNISGDRPTSNLPFTGNKAQISSALSHSELNQPRSRDSSHFQSHGSNYYSQKCPFVEEKPSFNKYQSPMQSQNHRSPSLNYVSNSNPNNEYSMPPSQNMNVCEESSSRPNASFLCEEENSNEKYLALNFSSSAANSIKTVTPCAERAITPSPEKRKYPYCIEMKQGMFRTVKQGPEHEKFRIDVIVNYGSGDLKDGGFSWGWTAARSSALPFSKPSSVPKDKNHLSKDKDIHRSKRKLEGEKTSCSPSPKKAKVKGNLDGRDVRSNKEKPSKISAEVKDMKNKSSPVDPPKHSSSHTKPMSTHLEKTIKSSKSSNLKSSDLKNLNSNKHSGVAVSPVVRKISPINVPSSEMTSHLSKTDGLGKNVIDDSTMGFISSKKERSAVYSGKKSAQEVQSLKAMCFELVKKNIMVLKIGHNVPFELLLPALKLCTPSKLYKVEDHNKHILRYTDLLWKKFCEMYFREEKRFNGEAWRDVYWRARHSRDKKLKKLTASISNGMAKAHPERQAKWVGVGANNPEQRQRKPKIEEAHKTETHRTEAHKIEEIPPPKSESNAKLSSSTLKQPSNKKRSGSESSSSSSPQFVQKSTSVPKSQVPKTVKKTLAPLMSKTKKMLNLVNRRR